LQKNKAMRLLKVQPHLSDIELKAKMLDQKFAKDFQSYQIIYSVQTNYGKKAEETAKILGITKSKVLTTVASYNKAGSARQPYKVTGGRREARCIMSLEKEEAFLKSVEKEAISGQIITYRQIKSKLEKEINRTVSDD
jgi:transposase